MRSARSGTSGPRRGRFSPDVPTFVEQGYKEVAVIGWFGYYLPARASQQAVQRLNASLREALGAPELADALAKFEELAFEDSHVVLKDISAPAEKIAKDLGKAPPQVIISGIALTLFVVGIGVLIAFAGLDTMWLSGSSAFTQQWRTSYHFNTAAGPDVFFNLLERQLDAMLHPNYTDEEIPDRGAGTIASNAADGSHSRSRAPRMPPSRPPAATPPSKEPCSLLRPPMAGAAMTMRLAIRDSGSDCSQTLPGPCSTAKNKPSPENSADFRPPTYWMS